MTDVPLKVKRSKPTLSTIPPGALLEVAAAMESGAKKYGRFQWRESRHVRATLYYDAIMRHLLAWMDGEDTDEESGYSHLAHIAASALVLLDARELGVMVDDRKAKGRHALKILRGRS